MAVNRDLTNQTEMSYNVQPMRSKQDKDLRFDRARWQATAQRGFAYYAAYGSNLNLHQMLNSRCPAAQPVTKFRLDGWRLVFRGVADIVRDPDASVPVGIFKITPECERALDRYEGYPTLYTKAQAHLEFADGTLDKVMFYVMTNREYESAPGQGYFDTIMRGYDDFGMSQREKDALIEAAICAGEYEERHLAHRKDMRRDQRGKYHKVYQPSFAGTTTILDPRRQEAIRDAELRIYDPQDWREFCERYGFDPADPDLLDDQTTLSDLIEQMRERNDD